MTRTIPSRNTRCRFGVAVRDVTPPVGIYARWWGAAAHDVAEGVHRPLLATAALFAPLAGDGAPLALVTLDHCCFQNLDDEATLRTTIRERAGLPEANLLLSLSHAHSTANVNSRLTEKPGGALAPAYLARLADEIAEAIGEASRGLAPAWITYGRGRCDLAGNRDFWDDEADEWACGYNPDAPADDTLLVARVTGDDGATRATLFNYACHPTSLAWGNRLLSPDFVGAAREVLTAAFNAPALFLQGASGELGPRDGYSGDAAVADRNGRQLGHAAASALVALPPPATTFAYTGIVRSGANLGTWAHQLTGEAALAGASILEARIVPVEVTLKDIPTIAEIRARLATNPDRVTGEILQRLLNTRQAVGDGATRTVSLWLWRLGDAALLAVPEEPYSILQQALRADFPGLPLLVLGVANGAIAYLPPTDTYGTGRYQERQSPYAAGCLEATIAAARNGIAALLA